MSTVLAVKTCWYKSVVLPAGRFAVNPKSSAARRHEQLSNTYRLKAPKEQGVPTKVKVSPANKRENVSEKEIILVQSHNCLLR